MNEQEGRLERVVLYVFFYLMFKVEVIYEARDQRSNLLWRWAGGGVLGGWFDNKGVRPKSGGSRMLYVSFVLVLLGVQALVTMHQMVHLKTHAFSDGIDILITYIFKINMSI